MDESGPQERSNPQRGAIPGVLTLCVLIACVLCYRGDIEVGDWEPNLPDLPQADHPGGDRPPGGRDPEDEDPPPGEIEDITHEPDVARTICQVAEDLGADDKVLLSAFEAALVESNMRNIEHGDRDSLGVFQQRPSQGWGTPKQILDPAYAARQYISRAIESDKRNPDLTPGHLAQSVQRSAFPDRYDEREGDANALIAHYC